MGARILIVEDNPANLELMRYLLEAFGHTPISADNGADGFRLALTHVPDLILSDVQLPFLNGYELVQLLKDHASLETIPLVAVTALAMVGDRDRVLAMGFDGYIPKPIEPEMFVAQVEAFLGTGHHSPMRPVTMPAPAAPARPPPSRATVLAVADVAINRELIRSTLEPVGYQVIHADSFGEALTRARRSPPDLIFSDLHCPVEVGLVLLRAVKADPLLRTVPFICGTSMARGRRERTEASALEATRFIQRPIEPEILLEVIGASLSEWGRQEKKRGNKEFYHGKDSDHR